MTTNTPFDPQPLYIPSKEEEAKFNEILSSWMNLETMLAEIKAIEERVKWWNVLKAPQFKIVREARQAVEFASCLQGTGSQVEALRMNEVKNGWPDFWLRMNGNDFPCELTAIYNDRGPISIPIHGNEQGDLIIDANTDYSAWPEDQLIKAIPHAGLWKDAVRKAIQSGHETPLGIWPQGDIIKYLPEWTEKAVRDKNSTAQKGNYVEGTVLVIVADFEIKVAIPVEMIKRLDAAMRLGTAFRAVCLHVPNSMFRTWDNPAFPPFPW